MFLIVQICHFCSKHRTVTNLLLTCGKVLPVYYCCTLAMFWIKQKCTENNIELAQNNQKRSTPGLSRILNLESPALFSFQPPSPLLPSSSLPFPKHVLPMTRRMRIFRLPYIRAANWKYTDQQHFSGWRNKTVYGDENERFSPQIYKCKRAGNIYV